MVLGGKLDMNDKCFFFSCFVLPDERNLSKYSGKYSCAAAQIWRYRHKYCFYDHSQNRLQTELDRRSEFVDEARTINITDILGQLNYIGSNGHFLRYRSQSSYFPWSHHACWVLCRPCVRTSIYCKILSPLCPMPWRSGHKGKGLGQLSHPAFREVSMERFLDFHIFHVSIFLVALVVIIYWEIEIGKCDEY